MEVEDNSNCSWCARNGSQDPRERNGKTGNQWENRNHPDHSIIKISSDTERSPEDLDNLLSLRLQ